MSDFAFFLEFFENLSIFLPSMIIMMGVLFLTVRKIAPAGYLDPLHFYWTFTFGSAYGIVVGLFLLGHIDTYLFMMVLLFGLVFIVSFRLFARAKASPMKKTFVRFLVPRGQGTLEFAVALTIYVLLLVAIIAFVGVGMFAESNRFEQNRGFGMFVRVADALRLFVVAYLALLAVRRFRNDGGLKPGNLVLFFSVLALIVVGSVVNGSKFALLEAIYAVILAIAIHYEKPKFRLWVALSVFFSALGFALLVLSANLRNDSGAQDVDPQYTAGDSLVVERLLLRVIANADKYYFSLPNRVIEELKTDNVLVAFGAPFIGTGRMSSLVGYSVDELNIGRQTIMYFYPWNDVAGGPTSHFDLFAYKYFGFLLGPLFVLAISFLLSSLLLLAKDGKDKIFYSALAAAIWLRSQALMLEPTVGLAYVFDLCLLFFLLKISCAVFSKKQRVYE